MHYTINEKGIAEIKDFMSTSHKAENFDQSMLQAWASDAEFQLAEGNGACIEVSQFCSKSGRTETFTISDAGIDAHAIDE